MLFRETKLPGVFIIDLERIEDERGFLARTWCQREFAERGLCAEWAQCNISYNAKKGTLRRRLFQEHRMPLPAPGREQQSSAKRHKTMAAEPMVGAWSRDTSKKMLEGVKVHAVEKTS